ncbi:hypothetical protein MBLNU457_5105t1 [Dothideomycetes sp. NU457]
MSIGSLKLSDAPKHHPDCCLAISRPLLDKLVSILPHAPAVVLSIGSGTGLLEAAILQHSHEQIDIVGVEVSLSVNKYLPEQNILVVNGTWALHVEAQTAAAWMFVYPREPKLVETYIDTCASDAPRTIVWLGPKNDWPDYAPVFDRSQFIHVQLEDCGIASYEAMVVATKK